MPARVDVLTPLDLETVDDLLELDVPSGNDEIIVQVTVQSGTWAAGVVKLERSIVGGTASSAWQELAEPLTITSSEENEMSTPRYLGPVRFLRARVSTDQSGTPCIVEVAISSDSTYIGALRSYVSA